RQDIIRSQSVLYERGASCIVKGGTSSAELRRVENGLLGFAFDCPNAREFCCRLVQHIGAREIGMVAIDTATRVHKDNITRLIKLFAVCAVRQRGCTPEGDNTECRAARRA